MTNDEVYAIRQEITRLATASVSAFLKDPLNGGTVNEWLERVAAATRMIAIREHGAHFLLRAMPENAGLYEIICHACRSGSWTTLTCSCNGSPATPPRCPRPDPACRATGRS
jgi:hypothetical protein